MKMLLKYFHEFKNKVVLDQKTLLHNKNADLRSVTLSIHEVPPSEQKVTS